MAEDFDVEAMLEAPYNSISNGFSLTDHHSKSIEDEEKKHKRSRSRERKRSHSRSRSKERKHKRSKERRKRSRSRERKHKRSKDRSRSRERHKRSRSRDKRSKSRDKRSRSRDRRRYDDRYDDRYSRRYRDEYGSPRRRSPSYTREEDRILEEADRRTVFAMQLAARVRPRDLEDFFSQAGKVREVRLIMDNKTKRHKGIAYIEFRDSSSVSQALQLNGQKLCGYPITIQHTNAEKNKSSVLSTTSSNGSYPTSSTLPTTHAPITRKQVYEPLRLYVGSLHFNVTEDMLRSIFEPFGTITKIELMRDTDTLRSKGYGFITFANSVEAKKALDQMNGYELAGRPMKVNYVTERGADGQAVGPTLDSDELDRTGIDLGAKGRLQLMAKLAEGTGIELPKAVVNALNQYTGQTTENTSPSAIATPCFMLTNLFDPETEVEEDWPEVIKEEVLSECRLHGGAVHIFVDSSSKGNVYVKATSILSANKCVSALHGRWFSGKQVCASYIPASNYHQLFSDSLNATQPL